MNKIFLTILAVGIVLLIGWYFWGSAPAVQVEVPEQDATSIDMKKWTWVETVYNNDTELVPKNTEAFTITFNNDGTFSATTDCNSMGGGYEIDGNKITFGDTMMTLMFCEGSQESEFASMFNEIQSFFFTEDGKLVLELKFDTGSAIFR